MKIGIIGAGQLGSYLFKKLKKDYVVNLYSHKEYDITNFNVVEKIVEENEVIINCAAYTNVDGAEENIFESINVNAVAPMIIFSKILYCNKFNNSNKKFIHISSETVYGSNDQKYLPIKENENKTPICIYSFHKKTADDFLENACSLDESVKNNLLILRSGWLFGPESEHNFISKIKKLLEIKENIKVVTDQIGSLTCVDTIYKAVDEFLNNRLKADIYNIADEGYASRYEVADFVKNIINSKCIINKCTSKDFQRKANVAKNSCLDCSKLKKSSEIEILNWKENVEKLLKEVL